MESTDYSYHFFWSLLWEVPRKVEGVGSSKRVSFTPVFFFFFFLRLSCFGR